MEQIRHFTYSLFKADSFNSFFKLKKFTIGTYSNVMMHANYFAALLLMFWLPFSKKYVTIFIGFWVLTWLLEGNFVSRFKNSNLNKYQTIALFLPIVLYAIHVISYFMSNNKNLAGFDLEVKIPLLLFPLLTIGTNTLYRLKRTVFLKVFVAGLIGASMVCIINAFIRSFHILDGKLVFETAISPAFSYLNFFELIGKRLSIFSYTRFSVFHHPAYFAMYLNLGLVATYYLFRRAKKNSSKFIYVSIALLFSCVVYFLSSRAGLISLFLVFVVLLVIEVLLQKRLVVLAISFAYVVILSTVILNSRLNVNINSIIDYIHQKISFGFAKNNEIKEGEKYTDPRLIIWHYSMEVASENPIFGVGIGDVKESLYKKYESGNFKSGIRKVFNSHNQYLELLIAGGLLMILAFMAFILFGIYMAVVRQRYVLGALMIIVAVNMAFESMFNTMAGTIFIMFFYSLLVRFDIKSKTLKEVKALND